jgi:DUF1365 family protein
MSHQFFEGSVYHKRFHPKTHEFTYPFYLLDIDLSTLDSLNNTLFSLNSFNLFSFKSKDHFGNSKDFSDNVKELLHKFKLQSSEEMHFITLPRVFNFVFNPISVLVLFKDKTPTRLLAEVHNYNGGNIVYDVELHPSRSGVYEGSAPKDMHVSPFLERTGEYKFTFECSQTKIHMGVTLYEEGKKKLIAYFNGNALPFSTSSIRHLMLRHTFLTFGVVTRTLWQSFKLYLKGLRWYSPIKLDQTRRY